MDDLEGVFETKISRFNCAELHRKLNHAICISRIAFPLPKNGQFNELFNYAIRKTVESGEMDKFRTKWATEGNKQA